MRNKFKGHIHVHTEYSMLDGMSSIENLILKAKELGQEGICITDHGSTSGLYQAWKLSKKYNFNVLYGSEFYIEAPSEDTKTGHIILIAKNNKGLSDLFKLQQLAFDNMYYKPRVNLELLNKYKDNLVCTTACLANPINQYLMKDEKGLAYSYYERLKNIFDDDLYVEYQSATNPDVQKNNNLLSDLIDTGQKTILTSDVHYLNKEDWKVHEVLLAIQQKVKMDSPKRFGFPYNDYWLKNEDEMYNDFNLSEDLWNDCMKGIDEIFDKCKGVDFIIEDHLPKYCKSKQEEDILLKERVFEGIHNKLIPRNEYNGNFKNDLDKELKVISDTGYSGYFLTVQEYANWARHNNIQVGDGRGSGAGSKVAYTIGITDINPQKYDLLFERFLTPERQPDFDIDFSDIDAVFKHLQDRYGRNNVARVGAFTTFTAKSATIKVMSAYGYTFTQTRKITNLMPDETNFTLEEAIKRSDKLKTFFENHKDIYHAVSCFEGIIEHMSTHAGGVVICQHLTELLPTMVRADDKSKLIIALDKHDIEELGHYKFDILGLSGLDVMKNITDYVNIDWSKVNFEDENVYKMLQDGKVTGVFQLSNQADKVVQQHPTCFEDIISINALIRPGVCDWNEYLHARNSKQDESKILPFMKSTHNLIVYQDQYLQLANYYAGWDIGWSDKHIRKNKDILNDVELKAKWINDTKIRGFDIVEMSDLWNTISHIVSHGYGFNRAHSASYATLTYKTAYCKYYYPKEFYAAYLTKYIDKPDKVKTIVGLLKEEHINLLHPDINKSEERFIPTKDGILMPINSIKGVGGSAIWAINNIKPIKSFEDFMNRRVKKFVRSTTIVALIKSGAFDFEGKSRYELLCSYDDSYKEEKEMPEYKYDYDAFGFYISKTPFDGYHLKSFADCKDQYEFMSIMQIDEIKVRQDRRKEDMAFCKLSNNKDSIDVIIFSSIWKNTNIKEKDIVFVKGRKDRNKLIASEVSRVGTD